MEQDAEIGSIKVLLKKNGELYYKEDGAEVPVGRYDRTRSHLEFENAEMSVKLYNQCVSKIGTVAKGTMPSGMVIKTFGIKNQASSEVAKNAPPRPKMSKLGDCTPELVKWMFKYDLPQAIIRYGVFVDENGEPIRKRAKRVFTRIEDKRNFEDDDLEWIKTGKNTQTKAPVSETREFDIFEDVIVARRPTVMTYTPAEVRAAGDSIESGEDDGMADTTEDQS